MTLRAVGGQIRARAIFQADGGIGRVRQGAQGVEAAEVSAEIAGQA